MVTIQQLIKWTRGYNPTLISNAGRVRIKFTEVTMESDENGDYKQVIAMAVGDTKARRVVLKIYGEDHTAKVWVSCDCPYFLYHAEVALKKKGSSDVIFSNGQDPVITNPGFVPIICKHLLASCQKGALVVKPKDDNRKQKSASKKPRKK